MQLVTSADNRRIAWRRHQSRPQHAYVLRNTRIHINFNPNFKGVHSEYLPVSLQFDLFTFLQRPESIVNGDIRIREIIDEFESANSRLDFARVVRLGEVPTSLWTQKAGIAQCHHWPSLTMAGSYSYAQPHFRGLLFECMFAGDSIAWSFAFFFLGWFILFFFFFFFFVFFFNVLILLLLRRCRSML
jgi:hypothetical protein